MKIKIRPYAPSPANRYSRLFPPSDHPFDPDAMARLGRSMRADTTTIPNDLKRTPIAAGYTYFGQFIGHDLTQEETPLCEAGRRAPCEMVNHRTPWLDLDHLYGDGPHSLRHKRLYADDGVSFRLGEPRLRDGTQFDVPLDESGRPELADDRNNENLIVRQLHAMFLKLHNAAVKELPEGLPRGERFEKARERVRWQYQWLVRHDFLARICKNEIYHDVVLNGNTDIDWEQDGFSIPVEFSEAAFRFGHSMVRKSYILNTVMPSTMPGSAVASGLSRLPADVPLEIIFAESHTAGALSTQRAVDWRSFFGHNNRPTETAMAIDTAIVTPLFALPRESIRPFTAHLESEEPLQLAIRTLQRGMAMRLATGEQVTAAFRARPLSVSEADRCCYGNTDPWANLTGNHLEGGTPLWYYVLLEAQLEEYGVCLGTVGSKLVAEVIEGSLRADSNSFISRNDSKWVPPAWSAQTGKQILIKCMGDIVAVVG